MSSAKSETGQQLLDELTGAAAALTGFSLDAILPDAIRRAARTLLASSTAPEILQRARGGDPAVAAVLSQAVTVGETYFFRHAEHFRFLTSRLLPELLERPPARLRLWSAGCATGEEPWSIAACLLDVLPPGAPPLEVLATDLLPRNLAAARTGVYGAWSQRPSAPLLHPITRKVASSSPAGPALVRIDDRLRPLVRFAEHNLLEPIDDGPFHAIFCRNVLVYFSPEASRRAVAHLTAALAPGGALLLGSMDVPSPPEGLVATGAPQDQIWRRPDPSRPPAPSAAVARAVTPLQPFVRRAAEPVALHLRALVHVERGNHPAAARALTELVREAPDYVPGLLERALLHVRLGERAAATSLMREVLRRSVALPGDELVAAPEPLPASFFVHSAEAFLRAPRRGE